jgi:hypothetical protein
MPAKRDRAKAKSAEENKKNRDRKLDHLRTLISIIAPVRDVLHTNAALNGTDRPPLREPIPIQGSHTSISQQSDKTKDLLLMLQSWATLQVTWRQIIAVASNLSEEEWYQLKCEMIGERSSSSSSTSSSAKPIILFASGNPRKESLKHPDDALCYRGDQPKLIDILESDAVIDLNDPVGFLIAKWYVTSSLAR